MSLDLFAAPAAASPPRVAQVALPLPVDQLFDYAIPPELAAGALVGCRVRVRALRRSLVGIVTAVAPAPEDATRALRPLEKVIDPAPAISPSSSRSYGMRPRTSCVPWASPSPRRCRRARHPAPPRPSP